MDPAELESAIVGALRPRGIRERVGQVLSKGYTVAQVCERLPSQSREVLSGGVEGAPGARRAIGEVHRALERLVAGGTVKRRQATYRVFLNTKGDRLMLVDLYSAR